MSTSGRHGQYWKCGKGMQHVLARYAASYDLCSDGLELILRLEQPIYVQGKGFWGKPTTERERGGEQDHVQRKGVPEGPEAVTWGQSIYQSTASATEFLYAVQT
jgi:hypothetical protein